MKEEKTEDLAEREDLQQVISTFKGADLAEFMNFLQKPHGARMDYSGFPDGDSLKSPEHQEWVRLQVLAGRGQMSVRDSVRQAILEAKYGEAEPAGSDDYLLIED